MLNSKSQASTNDNSTTNVDVSSVSHTCTKPHVSGCTGNKKVNVKL